MEKLNEVKQVLKYLEIDAKAYADNFSASMIVSTKNILAIAEAYRALEQRAEENQEVIEEYNAAMCVSNEAGYAGVTAAQTIRHLMERAEAAEAKLAELEKQEPAAFTSEHYWSELNTFGVVKCVLLKNENHPDFQVELFTRVSGGRGTRELVPEEAIPDENACEWVDGWNDCRTTILLNIEKAK